MSTATTVSVTYDLALNVAYIRTSTHSVAVTRDLNDEVLVDLDEFGMLVGIELLSIQAELPLAELGVRFHVPADVLNLLQLLRPSVGFHLTLRQGSDGVSRPARQVAVAV